MAMDVWRDGGTLIVEFDLPGVRTDLLEIDVGTKEDVEMYPSKEARELAILLRISRELDIVGDVSATVDNPSELLAWAAVLTRPDI
ncbi:MAG: hypothetical protein JWQ93_2730, partial [Marmoricola sp.]|nr:hypothetical protein [Marmoricola sp.]